MYGYESWTIKKAEHLRTDALELWCWRRLWSPLDCKEIQPVHPKRNQFWIFTGSTDAETPLATWCEELTPWKWPWCWARLKARGEGDNRGWDAWMASLTRWIWIWVNSGSWWWTGRPGVSDSWGCKESDKTERLNLWTYWVQKTALYICVSFAVWHTIKVNKFILKIFILDN